MSLTFEDFDFEPEPHQLELLYANGFQGGLRDPAADEALYASAPSFYAEFPGAVGIGEGKLSAPYSAVLAQDPEFGRYERQVTGDCFPAGAMGRMAAGTENPIESVSAGDYVVTHRGNTKSVLNLIKKPFHGELVRLKAEGYDLPVEATPDNRLLALPSGS